MKRVAFVAALAALAVPALPSASAEAASSVCVVDGSRSEPLSRVIARQGISCGNARSVVRGARKAGTYGVCGNRVRRYKGWTMRHTGPKFATRTKFTKGRQSFVYAAQGSCG